MRGETQIVLIVFCFCLIRCAAGITESIRLDAIGRIAHDYGQKFERNICSLGHSVRHPPGSLLYGYLTYSFLLFCTEITKTLTKKLRLCRLIVPVQAQVIHNKSPIIHGESYHIHLTYCDNYLEFGSFSIFFRSQIPFIIVSD